jgi:hypothetical protein
MMQLDIPKLYIYKHQGIILITHKQAFKRDSIQRIIQPTQVQI